MLLWWMLGYRCCHVGGSFASNTLLWQMLGRHRHRCHLGGRFAAIISSLADA